jgi:hypothetical protein
VSCESACFSKTLLSEFSVSRSKAGRAAALWHPIQIELAAIKPSDVEYRYPFSFAIQGCRQLPLAPAEAACGVMPHGVYPQTIMGAQVLE